MAVTLFLSPQELVETTILGGGIDVDKFVFVIESVQITVIEPLLGSSLYNKIISDLEGSGLSGDYLTMYEEFVQPITKNIACAEYLEIGDLIVSNGGIFIHTTENSESPTQDKLEAVSQKYRAIAGMHVTRFNNWIANNVLTEYNASNVGEVEVDGNIELKSGWDL